MIHMHWQMVIVSVSVHKIGKWIAFMPWCWRRCTQLAGNHSNYSTCKL